MTTYDIRIGVLSEEEQQMHAKKERKPTSEISKNAIDEKNLKPSTVPNAVCTGGMEEIGLKRIAPLEIPQYLLMHPALPRGIEIKANKMIRLIRSDLEGNLIPGKGEKAQEFLDYCKTILYDSGGPLFVKKMIQGAFGFGTSFTILQTDNAETKVMRLEHQHEIFFGPAKYPKDEKSLTGWGNIPKSERPALAGKMKIDPKLKIPLAYTQLTKAQPASKTTNVATPGQPAYYDVRENPKLKSTGPGELIPFGEEFSKDRVSQLYFDSIGDEPLGISLVQFLHLTIQYLLNMEKAGAQTMVNFGFNKWVANTPFKDVTKMNAFASSLANIQKDSVVVLPENITLTNIQPGTTEFDKIHPIYLQLIAMRLGIAMPLLVQDGTSTNKSTLSEQRVDMYDDFIADELTVEAFLNDAFLKCCKIKYGADLTTEQISASCPKFVFLSPAEDIDAVVKRNLNFSLMIRNFATAAKDWASIGANKDTVIPMIGRKIELLLEDSMSTEQKKSIDLTKNQPPATPPKEEKKEGKTPEEPPAPKDDGK